MTAILDSHSVALYLENHPEFFDDYPELMGSLRLTTQLGGRTVSLHERQVKELREKARLLELKLANLTHVAKDNDAIIEKFHQWVRTLLRSRDDTSLPETLLQAMREGFGVPGASLRIWGASAEFADAWFAGDGDTHAQAFADGLTAPYCGPAKDKTGVDWLEHAEEIQSMAIIPLRKSGDTKSFGLLVLGSPDPQRFSSELATDFLTRIGDTAGAALQGLLR